MESADLPPIPFCHRSESFISSAHCVMKYSSPISPPRTLTRVAAFLLNWLMKGGIDNRPLYLQGGWCPGQLEMLMYFNFRSVTISGILLFIDFIPLLLYIRSFGKGLPGNIGLWLRPEPVCQRRREIRKAAVVLRSLSFASSLSVA